MIKPYSWYTGASRAVLARVDGNSLGSSVTMSQEAEDHDHVDDRLQRQLLQPGLVNRLRVVSKPVSKVDSLRRYDVMDGTAPKSAISCQGEQDDD
jgi:hypothetical protein